uniref:Uncharacterized protein n=1 Tax=Panagrolaimus superbus TaxID=310955 RepID=A0A914Y3J7_9BILA
MRLNIVQSGLSMFGVMALIFTVIKCEDIFTELDRIDYVWPTAGVHGNANVTDIECYREIKSNGIGKIFKLHLGLTDKTKYRCIIKLPTPVDIQFMELNFADKRTFTRLLSGNTRSRPVLGSQPLYNDNPRDDYGEFTVQCLHGYIVVGNSQPNDSLTFLIKELDEDAPVVTEESCTKSYIHTRGERTLYF